MLAAALLLASLDSQTPQPKAPREFRAVWVATVDNIDWPSKRTLTTAQQKAELLRIFDVAAELNLNAIIFQIRPSTDSLYDSKIEPWSEYLTGLQGRAPDPYYDPLAFAVEEAHKRGMELHCWFNPYRSKHPAQKGPLAANHIRNTHPHLAKEYGRYLWMDPGEADVQKRSLDVMLDVVKRYDVDGVHIDDYFYPYAERDASGKAIPFPDDDSYNAYRARGGAMSRSDWRRNNVDTFVQRLYNGIKSTKRWVKFGISPFGIYRPGIPEGIKAGVDQYEDLSADALKWFRQGWCDYFTPQLYWPIKQTPQSYPVLLKWWASQNPKGRHLWPGNFTGRVRPNDGNWPPQEILDQIEITRKTPGASGNVHFSMRVFLLNAQNLNDYLKKGPYKHKAMIPPSPWLDGAAPAAPKAGKFAPATREVSWDPKCESDVAFVAVYRLGAEGWVLQGLVPAGQGRFKLPGGSGRLALTAVDKANNESAPAYISAG
jgi:uncharacterized lipoprotein YddW (UPF0748 family)